MGVRVSIDTDLKFKSSSEIIVVLTDAYFGDTYRPPCRKQDCNHQMHDVNGS